MSTTDLFTAIQREIAEAQERYVYVPVRIRVTRASLKGSLLVMPEELAGVLMPGGVDRRFDLSRREIRIHPDDWEAVREFARRPDVSSRFSLGSPETLYGIPILVEDGALPDED